MKLEEYIREKRKLHNLTQQELAERSGVGYRFVRELENGKPTVRMDKVNQGNYILKPQSPKFSSMPELEDFTMAASYLLQITE